MIPIPKRIHWDAHTGDLYVRCDEWEEHATGVKELNIIGLPDHLTEVSYWHPSRGYYRVSADRSMDMTREQCDLLLSWLMAARRQARNFLGIEES